MGGKSSAPAPPNYSPIAQSSLATAQLQQQTSADQLAWAKQQYADQAPRTNAYMDSMTRASDAQASNAQADRARYEGIYQPVEDTLRNASAKYSTPGFQQDQSAKAMDNVHTSFDAARANSLAHLEGYGLDVNSTRFNALDIGTRVSEAAATASAGTASRRNTEATGIALQSEAINVGKGYPGQVAQSYGGAVQSGGAGVSAGLNTSSTYGNLMGTSVQYDGLAQTNRTTGVAGMQQGGNFANQAAGINNVAATGMGSAIGSAVGAGASALALYRNAGSPGMGS